MALKMWLTAWKIAKNGNFWYKFGPNGKSWKCIEKLEYRLGAQLRTSLYAIAP